MSVYLTSYKICTDVSYKLDHLGETAARIIPRDTERSTTVNLHEKRVDRPPL